MSETITQTITDYVQAVTDANASLLREVFDPRASIVGNYEGATDWLSLEDFIHQIHPADASAAENAPNFQIHGIDQNGDTASVKLTTRLAGVEFGEYLSLLQRDKNWTIIHRLYYLQG